MQPLFREYLAECMGVFSMCVLGRHHWRKFPFYTVFQLIGSFMRAVTIYTLYYVTGPTATAQIFATYPADYVPQHLDRFGRPGTDTLLVCLLALGDQRNSAAPAHLEPLMVGLDVFIIGLSMGGNCGYPLNPARDLGPRVFTYLTGWRVEVFSAGGGWFWVPLVAQFLGAMVGVALYQLFIELHHPPLQLESDGLSLENKMAPGLEGMELGLKSFPKDIRSQSLAVIQLNIEKAAHLEEKVNHL